jgi:alpha-tubulin suppressor-like RCC1 family protein
VKCWGWNPYGAVGDGTNASKPVPTDVAGLGSGVSRIAAGEYHTCALLASGGVRCWGGNGWGQLGDGTFTDRWTPVDGATPVGGIVAIVAGNNHNCVVTAGGAARCWGRNTSGQLGDGSTTTHSTPPVDVTGLGVGVLGIAAGANHTCAVLADDVTKCWGDNSGGQLGDGSQTQRLTPVDVSPHPPGVSSLALGGNNSCAMGADGAVACWGANATGQLGDGTTVARSEATLEVEGLAYGAAAVSGADGHNCAITGAGGLRCWGNNAVGQVGDGTTIHRLAPVEIRAGQSIRWSPPAAIGLLQPARLTAAATSGLPVTLESLTPSFCTIDEGTLTGAAAGLCLVRARQAGDENQPAAPPQLRLIPVTPGEEPPRRADRRGP